VFMEPVLDTRLTIDVKIRFYVKRFFNNNDNRAVLV